MSPKNAAAVALGRKGGKATARNRTPEERAEAARKAVAVRWLKERPELKQIGGQITEGTKRLEARAKKKAAQ